MNRQRKRWTFSNEDVSELYAKMILQEIPADEKQKLSLLVSRQQELLSEIEEKAEAIGKGRVFWESFTHHSLRSDLYAMVLGLVGGCIGYSIMPENSWAKLGGSLGGAIIPYTSVMTAFALSEPNMAAARMRIAKAMPELIPAFNELDMCNRELKKIKRKYTIFNTDSFINPDFREQSEE